MHFSYKLRMMFYLCATKKFLKKLWNFQKKESIEKRLKTF